MNAKTNSILPPRFDDGQYLPNHDVVAADLIALVAGVNLASVNKVVLALNLISATLNEGFEDLLDSESLPTERADQTRIEVTELIAQQIASEPEAIALEPQLHFVERMSRH